MLVIADAVDKRKDGQGAGEAIVNATADVAKDLGWLLTAGNYQPTDSDVFGNNFIGQQTKTEAYRSGNVKWKSNMSNFAEAEAIVANLHGGYRDVPFMGSDVAPTLRNKRRAIKLDNSSQVDSTRGDLGNRIELAKLSLKELEAFSVLLTFNTADRKELESIIKAKQELRTVMYNIGVFGPGGPIFGEPGSANVKPKKKVIKTETSSSSYKESSQDGIVQLSDFPSYVEAFARADELNKTHPRPDGASWKVNIKGIPQVNKVSTPLPPELSDIVGGGFDVNKPSRKSLLNSKLNAHEKYNDGLAGIKQFLHGAVDKEMGSGFMGFNPMKTMAHSMLSRELSQYNDPSKVNSGMLAGTRAMMVDKMTGEIHPDKIKYILERFGQFASKFENYSMAEADLKRLETPDVGLATDAATALKHADDGPNNSLGVNIHNWDGFTSLVGDVLFGKKAMAIGNQGEKKYWKDNGDGTETQWVEGGDGRSMQIIGSRRPKGKAKTGNKNNPTAGWTPDDFIKDADEHGLKDPEAESFMGVDLNTILKSFSLALMPFFAKEMMLKNSIKGSSMKGAGKGLGKLLKGKNAIPMLLLQLLVGKNAGANFEEGGFLFGTDSGTPLELIQRAIAKDWVDNKNMKSIKGFKFGDIPKEAFADVVGMDIGGIKSGLAHRSYNAQYQRDTMGYNRDQRGAGRTSRKFKDGSNALNPWIWDYWKSSTDDLPSGNRNRWKGKNIEVDLKTIIDDLVSITNLMPAMANASQGGGQQPVIINNNQSSNVNNSSAIVANTTAHAPALPSGVGSSISFV